MKKSILFSAAALLLCACRQSKHPEELINTKASIPAQFRISDKGYKVITTLLNRRQNTTSLLYGNEQAYRAAQQHKQSLVPGETFVLITWQQQADAHWFGANIPGDLVSIETLTSANSPDGIRVSYQRRNGRSATAVTDTAGQDARINLILAQETSVMP